VATVSDIKVSIKNLYKIFGPNPASKLELVQNGMSKADLLEQHGHVLGLKDVNIDIEAKGIQVIMGLSGSGKSTLIRHINRLIEPTSGEIVIDGQDVLAMSDDDLTEFRRFKASMVFQKFGLLPHRTVADNAAYGLVIQGMDKAEAIEKSQRWVDRVGLSGFENHYPAQLSGGMQQRVGLARALATDAEILLMDEAFSALDPLIRTDMQDVLLGLQEELHKTIIFITHDLDEALRIGDNIAILRDGAVVQKGSPQEIVLNPADDYVRDFIMDINRARVLEVGSVMSDTKPKSGIKIDENIVIEEALQLVSANDNKPAIITRDGKAIGSVTLEAMISAIARPEKDAERNPSYR
jgi:glycine betaine/proline transport system ATP-binding protein